MDIKSILLVVIALILSTSVKAAVILNIDNLGADQHTIALDPVTFTVTADGTVGGIVFEDFFLTSNTRSGSHISTNMTAQIDEGISFSIGGITTNGTFNNTSSILDPSDLWYNIHSADHFTVTVDQTVTIGGTTSFSNSNLAVINTAFDQTAVLWEEGSIALSGSTSLSSVPVPAAVWLFGSGLIGLIGIARRKKV